jgi:2-polyprenyl-3-methyl-5-hydroxy-6-metoxy-1,4-benzoquinol methylase
MKIQVKRDFDEIYSESIDPWDIGSADSERYNSYHQIISNSNLRGSLLDIGCGQGAFTSRFANQFDILTGIDISKEAIKRASSKYPNINFYASDIRDLSEIKVVHNSKYDLIICSDVIYYLTGQDKRNLTEWVYEHLNPSGLFFVAAWTPGGNYLTTRELISVISRKFNITNVQLYKSNHTSLLCKKRERFIAITLDYETWQPIPIGKQINWDLDVVRPTEQICNFFEQQAIKITLFVEVAELIYLSKHDKDIFIKIKAQLHDLYSRGHDVQLHIHPSWLPQYGAKYVESSWFWDDNYSSCGVTAMKDSLFIDECYEFLTKLIREVDCNYRITCFRAGGYSIQPSNSVYKALTALGVSCDSSVFHNGSSGKRKFNFRNSFHRFNPWPVDMNDFKYANVAGEIIELPVAVFKNERLFIDNDASSNLIKQLEDHSAIYQNKWPTPEVLRHNWLCYKILNFFHIRLKCDLHSPNEKSYTSNDYLVAIGHSKAFHNLEHLEKFIEFSKNNNYKFISLNEMQLEAKKDIQANALLWNKPECKIIDKLILDVHQKISPHKNNTSIIADQIVKDGYAWCGGYSIVLSSLFDDLGIKNSIVDCFLYNHPKGRGIFKIDSHVLIEAEIEGETYTIDSMAGVYYCYPIREVLKNKNNSRIYFHRVKLPNNYFIERNYYLYTGAYFFNKVFYRITKKNSIIKNFLNLLLIKIINIVA